MKLTYRQIEPFVKSPDKAARVVLVYGPDIGLVSERSEIIGKTVVADLNDPFNVADISAGILADDPARRQGTSAAVAAIQKYGIPGRVGASPLRPAPSCSGSRKRPCKALVLSRPPAFKKPQKCLPKLRCQAKSTILKASRRMSFWGT